MKTSTKMLLVAIASMCAGAASADIGMGLRVGTLGYGGDIDIALHDKLTLRVGYSTYKYSHSVDDTDVSYDGNLKLSNAQAVLDWHPFASGFRLSLGGMGPGLSVDVVGKPTSGTYSIGNGVYQASQIGSLTGELKFGRSVSPYVGLGWGNVPAKRHRVTFLFDLGAIYAGAPTVNLNATCGTTLNAAQCTSVQTTLATDVVVEKKKMEDNASDVKWWPVISIGLGVRF